MLFTVNVLQLQSKLIAYNFTQTEYRQCLTLLKSQQSLANYHIQVNHIYEFL